MLVPQVPAGRALRMAAGLLLAAALGLSVARCSDAPADAPTAIVPRVEVNSTVAKVTVTPTSASVGVGGTVTLKATAYNSLGQVVTARFGWTSPKTSIAKVSGGVVTGVGPGAVYIKVGSNGFTAMSLITVTSTSKSTTTATAPASVTVSPASASIQPGATVQAAATVKDAGGKTLTGQTITWTTSASSVATVTATGLVSGLLAGSATIKATTGGVSGSAALTVASTSTAPPPPTTGGVAFSDAFENGFAPKQGQAGWVNTTSMNVMISTDVAHGGTHSLRFSFPGKPDCNDASAQQRFTLPGAMQEVWVEYYFYVPAGGEGGSARYTHRLQGMCSNSAANNKFITLYGPSYGGETTLGLQTWPSKLSVAGDSRINTAYSLAGRKGQWFYGANSDPFITNLDRGRWMQIRVHARVADFGMKNGVIQVWKNGTLILSNTALAWYDSSNTANYMTQGYLMGWADSGYTQTTNFYIDDFKIIDANPGW